MSDDPFDDPEFAGWADDVLTGMYPRMKDKAVVMSILPEEPSRGDVKLWVEIGAALMLDKPLILMVDRDTVVPEKLAHCADEIVRANIGDPDAAGLVHDAIERVMKRREQRDS